MEPKMTPKSSPNDPQRLPNSQKDTSKSALDFLLHFNSILDDFRGSKMTPKSILKPLSAPKGRLEASMETFGKHVGSMLA